MKRIISFVLCITIILGTLEPSFLDGLFQSMNVDAGEVLELTIDSNRADVYESDMPIVENLLNFDDIKHLLAEEYQNTPYITVPGLPDTITTHYIDGPNDIAYFNIEMFLDQGTSQYGDWHAFTYALYSDDGYASNVKGWSEGNPSGITYFREWYKPANNLNEVINTNVSKTDLDQMWLTDDLVKGYQTHQVEFRYTGFSIDGQIYSNMYFPNDKFDGYEDNYWYDRPWEHMTGESQGTYTRYAMDVDPIYLTMSQKVRENISEDIGDVIDDAKAVQRVDFNKVPISNYEGSWTFINSLGIPSPYASERKRVWHFESPGTPTEGLWYETFTLSRTTSQVIPDIDVDIEIINKTSVKNQLSTLEGGNKIILPEVEITLTLHDEAAYDLTTVPEGQDPDQWLLAQRQAMWDREDLGSWILDIKSGGLANQSDYKTNYFVNNRISDENEYYNMSGNVATFIIYDMEVDRADISVDGTLMVSVDAQAIFDPDGVRSLTDSAFDSIGDMGLLSLFNAEEKVTLTDIGEFKSEMINYMDMSQGDIVKYDFLVASADDETRSYSFSLNSMDEESVANNLKSFMATYASEVLSGMNEEDIPNTTVPFKITQIVTDTTGQQSSYSKPIDIWFGVYLKKYVLPEIVFPTEIWDFEALPVTEVTDEQYLAEKYMTIDGVRLSENEMNKFLNGNWNFGLNSTTTFYEIDIHYISVDDIEMVWRQTVKVKSTLPRPSLLFDGTLKQDRRIELTDNTENSTDAELMATFPITERNWHIETLDGDEIVVYEPESTSLVKVMQSASPGHYRVSLEVTNSAGRTNTTDYEFYVMPDYKADIVLNGWNFPAMTRDDSLDLYASIQSLDGDNIIVQRAEIWTDANEDGMIDEATETLIMSMEFDEFMSIINGEGISLQDLGYGLGQYNFRLTALEEFGEPYIAALVETNTKTTEVVDVIRVQNLRPLNEIYTDTESEYPAADVMILMDNSLTMEQKGVVNQEVVNIQNELLFNGIKAEVGDVDLTTYIYEENVATSQFYGTSYPNASIYYEAGAKSGTLDLTSVVNNDYEDRRTGTKTVRRSKTATGSRSTSGTGSSNNRPPSSISYNSGGYSGTLSQSSYSYDSWPIYNSEGVVVNFGWKRSATYSGTVSGYFSESYTYYVTVDQYTGYYEGIIREIVKQPLYHNFTNEADKYIIYVSNNGVNVPDDLLQMQEWGGTNLIVIGDETIESEVSHAKIDVSDIKENLYEAVNVIVADNPYDASQIQLVLGESLENIYTDDFDYEGDLIDIEEWQVVHDWEYFDNPVGLDPNCVATYSDESFYEGNLNMPAFNYPGRFEVLRRLKDSPLGQPEYGMYSNTAKLVVTVVRPPIAMFDLDWIYDDFDANFKVTFVDSGSYDPDYQHSREDRGIVDVKLTWWDHAAPSVMYYGEPNDWEPGHTYTVSYYVEDVHSLLSAPVTRTYTMPAIPPIQFLANARTLDTRFDLTSIPAGEWVELYDVWTRHPYDIYLEVGIYDVTGTTLLTPTTRIDFSEGVTGTKVDQDITWDNIMVRVPSDIADGDYDLRISAHEVVGAQETPQDFNVTVYTPIWENYELGYLAPIAEPLRDVPDSFLQEDESEVQFETSVYTDKVRFVFDTQEYYFFDDNSMGLASDGSDSSFFINNVYVEIDNFTVLTNGDSKIWQFNILVKPTMVEATYPISFYGYDESGSYSSTSNKHGYNPQSLNVEVMNLDLMNLRINDINDTDWKYLFTSYNGVDNGYEIFDEEFGVYQNNKREMIGLGYSAEFEIDSTGLSGIGDTITVTPSYYLLCDDGVLRLVDVYVSNGDDYELSNTSSLSGEINTILLNSASRVAYESDPSDTNKNTWSFNIRIPYSARFTPINSSYDEYGYEHDGSRLLVVLDIVARKASNGGVLNYTLENGDWATSPNITYGYNKVSNNDLLGVGVNHGEAIWFDLDNTLIDDVYMNREW